jgi:hypothetical protein
MNTIVVDDKKYRVESYWRPSKKSTKKDYNNKLFPYPSTDSKWQMREKFLNKLTDVERYLRRKNKFDTSTHVKKCLLCNQSNASKGHFALNKVMWSDSLYHYINKHNTKPSTDFIDFIFRFQYPTNSMYITRSIGGHMVKKHNKKYIRLDRNQIAIMDALMSHGGYTKKYVDDTDDKIFRFSEHAGLLDFDNYSLEKVVISGKTNIIDKYDDDIYLPNNLEDFYDYEYIFHTHPPTPKPGSRIKFGILYEFPSVNDMFHFMDHFNDGKTQGSIIIAPEGMYIIKRHSNKKNKLKMDESKFYRAISNHMSEIQDTYIEKYGSGFTQEKFYKEVISDHSAIDKLNELYHDYDFHVDYYHRVRDKNKNWIIDTIYLEVEAVEK